MTFGRKQFGRKQVIPPPRPGAPTLPVNTPDDDGKLRAIPKAVFDGPNGAFLRSMGYSPDDPRNIIPQAEDFDRMVQESGQRQELRRRKLEAELLARYGHNQIRPFFTCGEGVMNGRVGNWLIRSMKLMPYDEWNVTYLPTDEATARVMDLPLHPGTSIPPIDETIVAKLTPIMESLEDARLGSRQAMAGDYNPELAEAFLDMVDHHRRAVTDYLATLKPMVIRLIAEVQGQP